jgi:hypothetical protein
LEEEIPDLFDSNSYCEFQKQKLGACYLPPKVEDLIRFGNEEKVKLIPTEKNKFFELILKE